MAQVILTAVGSALGGPVGGFIGGQIGSALDRTALNALADPRQAGRRLTGLQLNQSSQGDPIKQVFGRARIGGTILWAARLKENRATTRASKTAPRSETYSYSLSFAVGLCAGPIDGIGRIWADGQLIDRSQIPFRLYTGDENQTPDALIEAVEGSAPAYRGLAYMVFEDLDITQFGNRPPNLSVEVFRRPKGEDDLESLIEGVCLIPGAGEFIYATQPNATLSGLTRAAFETQHGGDGRTDFVVSLDQLQTQLPNVRRVNLVISWFGTSLNAADCRIVPGVEAVDKRTTPLVWSVAGIGREDAHLISTIDGRPAYGGTPCDAVVIAAIQALKARGYEVTLMPFILMDCEGYPWRGRITSAADGTAGAGDDVAAFMGTAGDWGLRRFVRHAASLGVAAGGVDGVLLGSELRGLTTLRSDTATYPMVQALRVLAAEVKAIAGDDAAVSYGADWSEYFGHQPADGSGHVAFHLDPLWADDNIAYVGIDWYAPLTDWRDGAGHLDLADGTSIYDAAYLQGRIRSGEGFDWYYASDADRAAQTRTPISDGAYGEPWIFRPKDLVAWWSNAHHDRPGGVRSGAPTAWVPQSKPVRFVEIGCGAVDKGPNAPNRFLDPKSSESAVPPFSSGARDDRAQRSYLNAFARYYNDHNPLSSVYHRPMLAGMTVWCWDARPYPWFPQRADVWGDTLNWRTGHWLNGRVGAGDASSLIREIAAQAGVTDGGLDLSEVSGSVDGYVIEQPMAAAQALSPVLAWLGLEAAERGGRIGFVAADHALDLSLARADLAYNDRNPLMVRRDLVDVPASLTLRGYDLDRDYQIQAVNVRRDDGAGEAALAFGQVSLDLPLCLTAAQASGYAAYALQRLQTVRHTLTLDIDPALALRLEVGDTLAIEGETGLFRVTTLDQDETPSMTCAPLPAARPVTFADPSPGGSVVAAVTPSLITGFTLLELPCFGADESNVKPILVPSADPWTGVDVYAGAGTASLRLRGHVEQPPSIGRTLMALPDMRGSYLYEAAWLDIYLEGEGPVSRTREEVLSGGNFICVQARNGEWEIIQYLNATALTADTCRLSGLVRGQWGSEQAQSAGIAEEAGVILLPPGFVRADMTSDELNLDRLWRVGRTGFGAAVAGAVDLHATWTGLALRPRAPVHATAVASGGDIRISWLRRARFGGDGWDTEPPLCEDYELYRVEVYDGDVLKRSSEVGAPQWLYATADMAADFPGGFGADSRIEIAQMSQVYGWGPVLKVALG